MQSDKRSLQEIWDQHYISGSFSETRFVYFATKAKYSIAEITNFLDLMKIEKEVIFKDKVSRTVVYNLTITDKSSGNKEKTLPNRILRVLGESMVTKMSLPQLQKSLGGIVGRDIEKLGAILDQMHDLKIVHLDWCLGVIIYDPTVTGALYGFIGDSK